MRLDPVKLAICAFASLPSAASAWAPGVYPESPARMTTSSFTVDNDSRNDMISFWHAVYQASEGYESRVAWNGDYTGNNGTTSAVFVDDIERRLNYFRTICGVPSTAKVNSGAKVIIERQDSYKPRVSTTKSSAAQDAALILVRNYNSATGSNPALSHNPAPDLTGWSAATWNGLAKGNFTFGLYGPGAIKGYFVERPPDGSVSSSWNGLVGHRRWCLYPRSTDFATGDQPGSTVTRPPTNVFYVIQGRSEYDDNAPANFVSYPPAGYFPAAINSPYWSLSREDADFSNATIKMTDAAGKPIAVTNIFRDQSYGDPAIMWQVPAAVASTTIYKDTKFQVEVSGIVGSQIPAKYRYDVTLINPNRITSDQKLVGPSKMQASESAKFTFTPPPKAEGLQIVAYKLNTTTWIEDAENSSSAKIIDNTANSYSLFAKTSGYAGFGQVSGAKSFRLTFPSLYDPILRGVPEQSFELDREIIANSGAKLSFVFRRGYMTPATTLAVERSADGGVSWKTIGNKIVGVSVTHFDTSHSNASIDIPKSSEPIRIRFRFYTTSGAVYSHEAAPTVPTGIFIDDITTSNCQSLDEAKVNFISAKSTSFNFNSIKAGQTLISGKKWYLALRTKLGGKWFPNGPTKHVTITR